MAFLKTEEESRSFGGSDEIRRLEQGVSKRLCVLEKLKSCDVHTAAWLGDVALVRSHVDFAAQRESAVLRKSLRLAKKALRDLEAESLVAPESVVMEAPAEAPAPWSFLEEKNPEDDLNFEVSTTRRRRPLSPREGVAGLQEVALAYVRQLEEARSQVASAEARVRSSEAEASKRAANEKDLTDFGEGYRPLHYAAYAGHLDVVSALLALGADPTHKNDAGCDALFLAAQQGRADVARLLLDWTNKNDQRSCWFAQKNAVRDGHRDLCALDVARAVDRAPRRVDTRRVLLGDLQTEKKPRKPEPPSVFARADGAIELRWDIPLERDAFAVNHVKVKVLDAETSSVAAVVVVRNAAKLLRLPLLAGRAYVALIAAVSALGAGDYSDASPPVKVLSGPKKDLEDPPQECVEKDLKLSRARRAVAEGRDKRQRLTNLLRKEEAQQRATRKALTTTSPLQQPHHSEAKKQPSNKTAPLLALDDDDSSGSTDE